MHNSSKRRQDPDTLGQRSRGSVGLGSGLRGDCAEGSIFLFTKNIKIPIRGEEETEVPPSQVVVCNPTEGLSLRDGRHLLGGTRPGLETKGTVVTGTLPLTWKYLRINTILVEEPESKGSKLAELCSEHGQVGSRDLIRVQAGDIPQELRALCLVFSVRMREAQHPGCGLGPWGPRPVLDIRHDWIPSCRARRMI